MRRRTGDVRGFFLKVGPAFMNTVKAFIDAVMTPIRDVVMTLLKTKWFVALLLAVLALALLAGLGVSGYGLELIPLEYRDQPEITLSVLIVVGALGLLAALGFLAAVLSALDLANPHQALGLPEGSVRALIALLFIVLFAIAAMFLFRQIQFSELPQEPQITEYKGISKALLDDIPKAQIFAIQARTVEVSGVRQEVFDVQRRIEPTINNEETVSFAIQILTTVATLVGAVAGFYFGTRAVAAARGVSAPAPPPLIRAVDPSQGPRGSDHTLTITGKGFDSPQSVRLVQGTREILCSDIRASPTTINCQLRIGANDPDGKWDLVVVNADGGEDRLVGAFEVKAAA